MAKAKTKKYKFKPNKAVKKRFKLTKKGKLKHGHSGMSHLQSASTSKTKRRLGRPGILAEGHARNMRYLMGVSGRRPNAVPTPSDAPAAEKEASK